MAPLGDVDESEWEVASGDGSALALPPAIEPAERDALLAQLVAAFTDRELPIAQSPAQALSLARELGRLLDELAIEGISFDRLEGLVEGNFASHWQRTLKFLAIVGEAWPRVLAERGQIDAIERRTQAIRAQAMRWREQPPATPVIAAGSTGSQPATRELLSVIAGLPQGKIVLPGLDRDMDDRSWMELDETHPQFGLRELLKALGRERRDVADWPGGAGSARHLLITELMRPAETTEEWVRPLASSLEHVTRADCATPHQEALVIALALRRILQEERKTAALVTPDRGLARRVTAELGRWNIDIDDSAGTPLGDTPSAGLLQALVGVVDERFAPVALLALLKHPLCTLGGDRAAVLDAARRLDRKCLRGLKPMPGLAAIRARIDKARFGDLTDRLAVHELIDRVEAATAGLAALDAGWRRAGRPARRHHCRRRDRRFDRRAVVRRCRRGAGRRAGAPARGLDGQGCHRRRRVARPARHHARARDRPPKLRPPSAARHLGAAGGAPAARRPAGAGRAERGHLAAGGRDRPLAQPADARDARPAAARAPHRIVGARLRRGARRRTRAADPRRTRRRRPDRAVALAGAARCPVRLRARRQVRAARIHPARPARVSCLGRRARPSRRLPAVAASRAPPAARGAADAAFGFQHRAMAPRPVRPLCTAHPGPGRARSARGRARGRRSRQRAARRAGRVPGHPSVRSAAARRVGGIRGAGREASRHADDGAGRARLLVAALPAPGALVHRHGEPAAAQRHAAARQRDHRQADRRAEQPAAHHRGARRSHRRDRARRLGRDRLQDRPRADQSGARGAVRAAAAARGGDGRAWRLRQDRRQARRRCISPTGRPTASATAAR